MQAPPIKGVREALVTRLKASAPVTALLPAAQIYGERSDPKTPWPFSRMGEFDGSPGQVVVGNVHVFSKSIVTDEVNDIAEVIGTDLDGAVLQLEADGRRIHVELVGARTMQDSTEQSGWHAVVAIRCTIKRDCDDR